MQALLEQLLLELLFQLLAEWHHALVLVAVLGVIAAQSDELLADWTTSVGLAATLASMCHHTFHLLAAV
jgi:hypothetical protein